MATDNLMKAVVDAIAESDNEIGGYLITRLREAHEYGRGNGSLAAANPTRLTSAVDIFDSGDVGRMIDILGSTNFGSYTVASYLDAKNVTLQRIDGIAPTFSDETDVVWRFSSLRVETTLEFAQADKNMSLWVGEEPEKIPYTSVVQTAGAQEFLGLGEHEGRNDGRIDVASPNDLDGFAENAFSSSDVGKAIWTMPKSTLTGNEGVRVISAVSSDGKVATLSGSAFVADELNVMWFKKTYAGDGYLTALRAEDSEVIDASESYSALNQLRRALLVEYAEGEELDRIGRRYGVTRPRGLPDEYFRRVLKILPYMAKTTVYSLEILLAALFPQGGWDVYEDLVSYPNEVFISVPLLDPSEDYEGKTFLDDYESLTSDSATQITVTYDPITIVSVKLEPFLQQLDFAVLPSADTPAWTYVNEGDTEGTTFNVTTSGILEMTLSDPLGDTGGYYQIDRGEFDHNHWDISAWFRVTSPSPGINGYPFKFVVDDGQVEACLMWCDGQFAVGQPDETTFATASMAAFVLDAWIRIRFERRGESVRASVNGVDLFGDIDAYTNFGPGGNKRFQFGYWDNGNDQDNTSEWAHLLVRTEGQRDYWNLKKDDGTLANPATLTSPSNPFVSGDTDKLVRIHSQDNENNGLWQATYVSAGQITLSGVTQSGVQVDGQTGVGDGAIVTINSPLFRTNDVNKDIKITGSGSGNDGTYPAVRFIDNYNMEVTNAGGFTAESNVSWEFEPNFSVESSVDWELIDAGSTAAKVLTLRDSLPAATIGVKVWYTTVLSAQIMLNEFVTNKGEAVGAPDLYYPFYLYDVDSSTRQLVDEITAAGVIPNFDRKY